MNRWSGLLILTVVVSLTVSLATRFSAPTTCPAPCAKSVNAGSTEPMRQHCSSDAIRWFTPIQSASLFKLVTTYSRITPTQPVVPDPLFAQALYDRPPPSSFSR